MQPVFTAIRKANRNPTIAAVFGIVVYTDADFWLKEILNDNAVLKALNQISGPQWLICIVRGHRGHYDLKPIDTNYNMVRTFDSASLSPFVWNEPKENALLLTTLGIRSTESVPCLQLYFPYTDDEAYTLSIPLNGASREEAFESLRTAIVQVTETIADFDAGNLKNAESLHREISTRLLADKHKSYLVRLVPAMLRKLGKLIGFSS
jgi:hypothetical protein